MSKVLITKKEARNVLSSENKTETRDHFTAFLPVGSLLVMIAVKYIG